MDAPTLHGWLQALGRMAFPGHAAEFDGLDLLVMGCCMTAAHPGPHQLALLRAVAWMRQGRCRHRADGLRHEANHAGFDIAQRVLLGDLHLSRAFVALAGIGSATVLREFADTAVAIAEEDVVELTPPHTGGRATRVSLRAALAAGIAMLDGADPVSVAAARRLALGLEALCHAGGPASPDVEPLLTALDRQAWQARRAGDDAFADALIALTAQWRGAT